jgi:DNA gyrase subunit A
MGARIIDVPFVPDVERAYGGYALAVALGRAIPDARDGLKPVQRRILWAMEEGGYRSSEAFRKSARVVGDVMGKYHPHGDASIYDALVRLAQDFSMSAPLVQGQGNFGSLDKDPPAAMRYTESRLAKLAEVGLLADVRKDAVDWRPTYDGSMEEPVVLPAAFPNLLVNGAEGVAVGYATRIPPHALAEVCAAAVARLRDPALSDEALERLMPGPDFPTGGVIVRGPGLAEFRRTGTGQIRLRARHHEEEIDGGRRTALVVDEIPYQIDKSDLVKGIADACSRKAPGEDPKVQGVQEVRDESGKQGVRIVIELRTGTDPAVAWRQLCRETRLELGFTATMNALVEGRIRRLSVADALDVFLAFRRRTVRRRTVFELRQARRDARRVLGLLLALSRIDAVTAAIRGARDDEGALEALQALAFDEVGPAYRELISVAEDAPPSAPWRLTAEQGRRILEMTLRRLTGQNRERLEEEATSLAAEIRRLLALLGDAARMDALIAAEIEEVARRFGRPRRTGFIEASADDEGALVPRRPVAVWLTEDGFLQRQDLDAFRPQARGGKGRGGARLRPEDAVAHLLACGSHDAVLVLTDRGRAFRQVAWRLPEAKDGRGRALVNVFPALAEGERVEGLVALPDGSAEGTEIAFCFRDGRVRRNLAADFAFVPATGKRFRDPEGVPLAQAVVVAPGEDLLLSASSGRAVRFRAEELRLSAGRDGQGVRGIALEAGETLAAACALPHAGVSIAVATAWRKGRGEVSDEQAAALAAAEVPVLAVAADGFGRRTPASAFRLLRRGGHGVSIALGPHGAPVAVVRLREGDDVLVLSVQGRAIRVSAEEIREASRSAQGTRLLRLPDGDRVAAAQGVPSMRSSAAAERPSDSPMDAAEG